MRKLYTNLFIMLPFFFLLAIIFGCESKSIPIDPPMVVSNPEPISMDSSLLKTKMWRYIYIPDYSYPDGIAFDYDMFVDAAFDSNGVFVQDNRLYFHLDPENPMTPDSSISPNNYRSEIHTHPWNIEHPQGTEQWIGWRYYFDQNYVIDTTSPITIFQNHPGVIGMSPAIELEIARANQIPGALGGEIQVINAPGNERFLTNIRPEAGDSVDIVIQVVHDLWDDGYLRVWLDETLVFEQKASTVYEDYPWGGNNKWGIYHHNFYNDPVEVASSLAIGAGVVDISMGTLRILTRPQDHHEYRTNAFDMVTPNQ